MIKTTTRSPESPIATWAYAHAHIPQFQLQTKLEAQKAKAPMATCEINHDDKRLYNILLVYKPKTTTAALVP